MARPINGVLNVSEFINTNPGEYTFENARFINFADIFGNGAYVLQVGFLLYIQASDPFTFTPTPGVYQRYRITDLEIIDTETVNGTIVWDDVGEEENFPTGGMSCLIAEPTPNKRLGLPALDTFYSSEVAPGASLAALIIDFNYILDKIEGSSNVEEINNLSSEVENLKNEFDILSSEASKTAIYTHKQLIPSNTWIINHNKGSEHFIYNALNSFGSSFIPDEIKVINENTIYITNLHEITGSITLLFHII